MDGLEGGFGGAGRARETDVGEQQLRVAAFYTSYMQSPVTSGLTLEEGTTDAHCRLTSHLDAPFSHLSLVERGV